jgi:hypothetical protein
MDSLSDSRKRPLDSDGDDGMSKRSNQGPGTNATGSITFCVDLNMEGPKFVVSCHLVLITNK